MMHSTRRGARTGVAAKVAGVVLAAALMVSLAACSSPVSISVSKGGGSDTSQSKDSGKDSGSDLTAAWKTFDIPDSDLSIKVPQTPKKSDMPGLTSSGQDVPHERWSTPVDNPYLIINAFRFSALDENPVAALVGDDADQTKVDQALDEFAQGDATQFTGEEMVGDPTKTMVAGRRAIRYHVKDSSGVQATMIAMFSKQGDVITVAVPDKADQAAIDEIIATISETGK